MESPAARAARRASPAGCCAGSRDFALVDGRRDRTRKVADKALLRLDVDALGLDQLDRRYLTR
jgi:Holliday junction resolvasome RuvABC ATP-dependent DNA helicase subunit